MARLETTNAQAAFISSIRPRLKSVVLKRVGLALALTGEPGIGKTHLAQQLLRETPCRSFSFRALTPLSTWLRGLPHPDRLPAWAEPLLLKLQKGEALDGQRTAEALGAWLAALAPVVLYLEDIHEASPEGLEWVQALAALTLRTKGVALLVTSRNPPPEPFEAYRLMPLSPEASQRLLEAEMGSHLPSAALTWIYERAQGNPLFSLEYLRYLARQGFLWSDGRQWHWRPPEVGTLPLTVEALLEQWLREVARTPTLRQALESKALLGPGADPGVWARVAELSLEELRMAQMALRRQGVLGDEELAHPLYQEVILRGLLPPQRRAYAQRALEALKVENPGAAVEFLQEAGIDRKAAMDLLNRAAQSAKAAGNVLQVARLQARMVAYADPDERGRLALEAAQILQHHHLQEARRLTEVVLQSPTASSQAVYLHAHLMARLGSFPDLQRLLAGLPRPLREQIDLHALSISTHNIAGNHQTALEIWNAHSELHTNPTLELLRAVAASALACGQMEQAQALCAKGLDQAPTPELRCEFLSIQALIAHHQGHFAQAEATIAEAIEGLSTLDAPRLLSIALVNRAAFLRMLNRYTEMGQCLEQALEIRRQVGDAKGYAFALAALGELLTEQGHYERAEEAITEAIQTLQPHGPSRFLTNAHAMASLLYGAQDTPISKLLALKHAETALGYARQMGSPRLVREILFDAALANIRSGYIQRGMDLASEAQALAEAAGNSPHDNFRTLWAQGLALEALRKRAEAVQALQQALAMAQQLKVAIDEQKLGLELDRITGNLDSARRRLAWFESHGLMNGAYLAYRYFPQLNRHNSSDAAPSVRFRLEVLGPMQWTFEGQSDALRGQKRKELLALLLEARVAGRAEVSKLELLDALYPGEDEEKATAALKELVHTARSSLGAWVVATTPAGYALGAGVGSDLEEFLRTGEARLWREVYLKGLPSLHETVRESVYQALRNCVQALLESDPREAARLGRILLEADPYDLEALRLTLKALRQARNHKSLDRLYQGARGWMLEVGECLPANWAAFLEPEARA